MLESRNRRTNPILSTGGSLSQASVEEDEESGKEGCLGETIPESLTDASRRNTRSVRPNSTSESRDSPLVADKD